jgi:Ran GTPase-activating protein (RanGAP) involved in mRNA processing and transport
MRALDLGADFADGVLLINLIEIAFSFTIGRYNMRPKSPMQKLDNVSLVFNWMQQSKIYLLSTDVHDIVAKKEKQIINVLSTLLRQLLLKGLIELGSSSNTNAGPNTNVKQHLLNYFKKFFPQLSVLDFWQSFRDGIVFCNIVNKMVPGKIDVENLSPSEGQQNLKLAFNTADTFLGIPSMLQPEEFLADKGDEQAIMNYLAMLISAHMQHKTAINPVQSALHDDEMNKLKNELSAKEQAVELAIITKQKELDELSGRLTAALESASNNSDALRSASVNEKKWKEATEKWRDSSQKWRASAEKWRLSDEKKSEKLSALEEKYGQEMRRINAEMYRMHREHEEVLERFKESSTKELSKARNANPNYNSGGNNYSGLMAADNSLLAQQGQGTLLGRPRTHSQEVLRAIQAAKSDEELLNTMDSKSGWLYRRRPNATFNKTRFKKVYFVLNGANFDYCHEPNGRIKGSFSLWDYHIVVPLTGDKRQREDGKDLIMRMNSVKSDTANVTIEFKSTPEEGAKHPNGVDGLTQEWVDAINTRISILNYIKKKQTKKNTGWGCPEIIHYVTDSRCTELVVTNKPVGIKEPLLVLRHALIAQRNRLKSICMSQCDLDDKGAEVLAELLKYSPNLVHMELPNNKIGATGAGFLCDGIAHNNSLQRLILDNNQLKDEGALRLAPALQAHANLSELSLAGNAIGDNGAVALCHALEVSGAQRATHHNFPVLNLAYNLVGDAGAIAIASLLPQNPSIKVIVLHNNIVGDAGLIALSASIEQTDNTLKELYLANNQISSKGVAALGHAFRKIKGDLTVDISENRLVSRAGIAAIVDAKVKLDYMLLKLYKAEGSASISSSTNGQQGGDDDSESVAKLIAQTNQQNDVRRATVSTRLTLSGAPHTASQRLTMGGPPNLHSRPAAATVVGRGTIARGTIGQPALPRTPAAEQKTHAQLPATPQLPENDAEGDSSDEEAFNQAAKRPQPTLPSRPTIAAATQPNLPTIPAQTSPLNRPSVAPAASARPTIGGGVAAMATRFSIISGGGHNKELPCPPKSGTTSPLGSGQFPAARASVKYPVEKAGNFLKKNDP